MSPKPFLKWAGGKTQLLPVLSEHIPGKFDCYHEPFLGAGALFFHLQPSNAVIADINQDLINCYKCIRNELDLVLGHIDSFPINEEFYYALREEDRHTLFVEGSLEYKAARLIYLNKLCYNGLFRVNKLGQFNVPYGKYKNPKIYDWQNLMDINSYFFGNYVEISSADFEQVISRSKSGDFVYCDPPYDVVSPTSNFTGYAMGGFTKEDHERLKLAIDRASRRSVKILQSNADTPFIRNLYKDYEIIEVQAKRAINSKADKRGNVTELLIKNY